MYNTPPLIRPLPTKATTCHMHWDSKLLQSCPPKEDHTYYQARFQILNCSPEERPPLFYGHFFQYRSVGLIRGQLMYTLVGLGLWCLMPLSTIF